MPHAAAGAGRLRHAALAGRRGGSTQLSLAQTAQWLFSTGMAGPGGPARQADPAPWLVMLDGDDEPVTVVAPPGRIADRQPRWVSTSPYGAGEPAWG